MSANTRITKVQAAIDALDLAQTSIAAESAGNPKDADTHLSDALLALIHAVAESWFDASRDELDFTAVE